MLTVERATTRVRESGQALVEYALILTLVVVACVIVVITMGNHLHD